jgi:hypothetical protein
MGVFQILCAYSATKFIEPTLQGLLAKAIRPWRALVSMKMKGEGRQARQFDLHPHQPYPTFLCWVLLLTSSKLI